MKNKLLIIGLLFLTIAAYAARETLTFSQPTDITLKAAKVLSQQDDVEVSRMIINFDNESDTESVSIYLDGQSTLLHLYPDPEDKSNAVNAAFIALRKQANIIMLHALENGHYK